MCAIQKCLLVSLLRVRIIVGGDNIRGRLQNLSPTVVTGAGDCKGVERRVGARQIFVLETRCVGLSVGERL